VPPQSARELDHRVDPSEAYPSLQLSDLGAMQGGEEPHLFLGEVGQLAGADEIGAEGLGDLDAGRRHQSTSNRAK